MTISWAAARGEKWRNQLSGMEAMLAPVDAPLIHALQFDAPLRIAEVGCGGGGTALEIHRKAPAGSVVHGFDISSELIEAAGQRHPLTPTLSPDGERGIGFAVADVATILPSERYDRLVSRFSTMFFDDPPAAFANLARWLVPGGRFAFAVWGPLSDNPWMTTVRDVVAQFVELPRADLEAPGPFRYAQAEKLRALLIAAGFGAPALHDWRGMLPIGGRLPAAEAATFALAAFSSFSELLAGETLERARQALTKRFEQSERDGAVLLAARVHLFTGRSSS